MKKLDHAEPWMIETAAKMVEVVKAANYHGALTFEGNGRQVRVVRSVDGIGIEFDYMTDLEARP